MKWLLDSYPQVFIALSILLPLLFWTYIGFAGRWKPWRNNIHVQDSIDGYITSPRGLRAIRRRLDWEQERYGWITTGMFPVCFVLLLVLVYILR